MKSYTEIDSKDLFDHLVKAKVLLVDVRNDDEVALGMIPGAMHIQLSMLPVHYDKLLNANSVVFYCHSGIRSAHAADFAVSKGVKDVFNLVGGVVAWAKSGYTLTQKNK